MKPKTKLQKEVAELMMLPQFHTLTADQARYGNRQCFERIAFMRKNGTEAICSECGTRFKVEDTKRRTLRCPHCGEVIDKQTSHRSVLRSKAYYVVPEAVGRFQVLRWFLLDTCKKAYKPAEYGYFEVSQIWYAPDGKKVIAERKRGSFYYIDSWSYSSDLEIRARSESVLQTITPYAVYSKGAIIPELKRRGITRKCLKPIFHGMSTMEIVEIILKNPRAETLWKAGHYTILSYFLRRREPIEDVWPSLKICFRNGYEIKDVNLWMDMVSNLRYLGKDIHSPKYVCPENLEAAHDEYQRLANNARERDRRKKEMERKKKEMLEKKQWEKKYTEMKKPYFGLLITDGKLSLKVLRSVKEFYLEGKAMHHCVYDMEYYKKSDCLILSATISGKRIETVEVSLKSFKVVQSRAVCNGNSKYHDQIISLVEKNMNKIMKCAKAA